MMRFPFQAIWSRQQSYLHEMKLIANQAHEIGWVFLLLFDPTLLLLRSSVLLTHCDG